MAPLPSGELASEIPTSGGQYRREVQVIERDGEPWFVAADVCAVLGIVNSRDAIKVLDDDEKMTVDNSDGHSGQRGGAQFMNIISESGLYTLIMRSNKPTARNYYEPIFLIPSQVKNKAPLAAFWSRARVVNPLETFAALLGRFLFRWAFQDLNQWRGCAGKRRGFCFAPCVY